MNTTTFGSRLAAAREKAGISQYKLARKICSSQTAISQWEQDKHSPNDMKLIILAQALKVDPEWLRTGEEKKAEPKVEEQPVAEPEVKDEPQVTMSEEKLTEEPQKEKLVWNKDYGWVNEQFAKSVEKAKDEPESKTYYTTGHGTYQHKFMPPKDNCLIYKAEHGNRLDSLNLCIRHIRDMGISKTEKVAIHKTLSYYREELERIVLFG